MLLAAAFLATSPLLVYYSRMFIHESLLVLFGMLALVSLTCKPRWGIAGILIGLMFATKESFAISIIAWSGAGVLIALENRKSLESGNTRRRMAGIPDSGCRFVPNRRGHRVRVLHRRLPTSEGSHRRGPHLLRL